MTHRPRALRPCRARGRAVLLLAVLAALAAGPARAQQPAAALRLPALFADHMVVQRDAPVVVWGWAAPGATVRVTLAGGAAEAVAGADGTWRAALPALAAGGPHVLAVEAGEARRTFADVLVGEVWIASGQSNMEWPLEKTERAAEALAGHDDGLRLFTVERAAAPAPAADVVTTGWHPADAEHAAPFSGVAFHFGRALRDSLGVPVGLIHSSWGGSAAEAWTSAERLAGMPAYAARTRAYQTRPEATIDSLEADQVRRYDAWKTAMRAVDAGYAARPYWSDAAYDHAAWETAPQPEPLGETILPFFNGVVWFRKTVDVPAAAAGRPAELRLGSMDNMDSTWVNGVLVGHDDRTSPLRRYAVPEGVLRAGENVVAVRIYDRSGVGGMLGGEPLALALDGGDTLPLGGDWAWRVGAASSDAPRQPRLLWHQEPTLLFNGMIAPLRPFRVRGVIWYQGESNASRAAEYRYLFPTLIEDWRAHWGQGALPFLFVQLANYMEPQQAPGERSRWAELREAQAMATALPNTGMAVALDVGLAEDVHPRDKHTVGRRLARQALAGVYGRDVVPAGPVYRGLEAEDGRLRLYFGNAAGGLDHRGDALRGFEVAGEDGRFHWADAVVDGATVVVSSPDVPRPAAVRYGWADNPDATLVNAEGLPAAPFRTAH